MEKKQLYRKLFCSTFYLSAFTFGGGYVIIPLMKKKFVDELNWIKEEEMLNFTAIAQSAPGPVAVNASILLGYRIAGLRGALVSILGTVLPPLLVITCISFFYNAFRQNIVVSAVLKGMQAGVAAVIADVVLSLGKGVAAQRDKLSLAVMAGVFVATFFFKINVLYSILTCGALGAMRVFWAHKKANKSGDAL